MKREERLKLLEKVAEVAGTEVRTSKNGSKYVVVYSNQEEVHRTTDAYTSTKNALHKIGKSRPYVKNKDFLVMLRKVPTVKTTFGKYVGSYKGLSDVITLKNLNYITIELYEAITDFLLRDYKAEWLKYYPNFARYFNFFKSFNSLREAKLFLGFRNMEFKQFASMDADAIPKLILLGTLTNETNKIKAMKHMEHYIFDVITMVNELGLTDIPCPNDFTKFHDDLSRLMLLRKYSNDIIDTPDNFAVNIDLEYKKIVTPVGLANEGKFMKHCVASRLNYLTSGQRTYYHIIYKGIGYTLEYSVNQSKILECKTMSNGSGEPLINYFKKNGYKLIPVETHPWHVAYENHHIYQPF